MINHTLKVVEIRKETFDTVTVSFKQPALKKVKYKAGQYLTVIFRINGRRYMRPYSFSSTPGIDPFLEITVKRVMGGIVSNHIIDKVKIGDLVEVIEPMGDFIINEESIDDKTQVTLWAAGSGITPISSILKYVLANSKAEVTLVFGNRRFNSVIFLNKIAELQKIYASRLTVWHFHTEPSVQEEYPNVLEGRIQPEKVLSVLDQESRMLNSYHYICGPTGLKEAIRSVLKVMEVPAEHVFSEDFELVKDEKELADVITTNVTIEKESERTTVEVVKGKSILEAGLDVMIELSYSCQTGNCLLCRGFLLKGEVRQIGNKSESKELKPGEYLLCCTYPCRMGLKFLYKY